MTPSRRNDFGQPIGDAVDGWTGAARPDREPLEGRYCWLEPLSAERHAEALFEAYASGDDGRNWTYLHYGPFDSVSTYRNFLAAQALNPEVHFYAISESASSRPIGVAAYLRIRPEVGSVEVGHLSFSPALQRTPASTEAMYLMMRAAFETWGYRRYEWKCDRLNAPSRAAAERLGFTYEGCFRNDLVVKGRNRDTAWFSITEAEWPLAREALEAWLRPENFDAEGRQRIGLADLRSSVPFD